MFCSEELLDILMDCADNGKELSKVMDSDSIATLSNNESVDIRIWAARALVCDAMNRITIETLCQLANDKDAQVRVEAVDSLCEFCCAESYSVMRSAIPDSDFLVRAYAAFGLAFIGKTIEPEEAKRLLICAEEKETECRALVGIYGGLYILGQTSALDNLIMLFSSGDYHIQCAVLNILNEVLNDENCGKIQSFIHGIDLSVCSSAVVDTIKRLYAQCVNMVSECN